LGPHEKIDEKFLYFVEKNTGAGIVKGVKDFL
jgi:hypothetical protein